MPLITEESFTGKLPSKVNRWSAGIATRFHCGRRSLRKCRPTIFADSNLSMAAEYSEFGKTRTLKTAAWTSLQFDPGPHHSCDHFLPKTRISRLSHHNSM